MLFSRTLHYLAPNSTYANLVPNNVFPFVYTILCTDVVYITCVCLKTLQLAQEYALQTPAPAKLAGLILAGPLSDAQLYINEQRKRVHTMLPRFIERRVQELEKNQAYDSPEYHVCIGFVFFYSFCVINLDNSYRFLLNMV